VQTNFAETVDPPYNAPGVPTTSALANGRKPRSIGILVAPPKYGVNIQQPPRRVLPPASSLVNNESSPVAAPSTSVRWYAADSVDYQDVKPARPLTPIAESSTSLLPTEDISDSKKLPPNNIGPGPPAVAPLMYHRKSLTERTFQQASDVILNSLTPASDLTSDDVTPASPSSPTSPFDKPNFRISGAKAKDMSVKFDAGKYSSFSSVNYTNSQIENSSQCRSLRRNSNEKPQSDFGKTLGHTGNVRNPVDTDGLSALGFSRATLPRENNFRDIKSLPMDKSSKTTSERDDLSHDDSSRPESNFTSVETVVTAGSLARLRSLAQDLQRQPPRKSPHTIPISVRCDDVENNFTSVPMHDQGPRDIPKASTLVPHSEQKRPLQRQHRLQDNPTDFQDDDGEHRNPPLSVLISTPAEVHRSVATQRKVMPDTTPSSSDRILASQPPPPHQPSQHSLSRSVTRTFGASSVTVTPLEKHSEGGDTWRRTSGHRSNDTADDVLADTMDGHFGTSRADPTSFRYDARGMRENDHSQQRTRHDREQPPSRRRGGGAFVPIDRETVLCDRDRNRESMTLSRKDKDAGLGMDMYGEQHQRHHRHRQTEAEAFERSRVPHSRRRDSNLGGNMDSAMMLDERTRMDRDEPENFSNIVNAFEDTTSKATVYDNVQYFRM